ncbi:hypothetical protein D1816_18930 [Aquimarina sp. AD10]|uniref:hypothetical protein n=1 Tax=Aquimarina TaxID=290174 RepID=UPI000E54AAC8|nr:MULTISPECIES: hypothetical protein [Aquimarina]AXT62349.1 hypothetical protein D1816_18930 [Aquimarina sp. AD10]RKM90455.1 hypothetical protein D7033_23450 [Aquimarina sp. AD10]
MKNITTTLFLCFCIVFLVGNSQEVNDRTGGDMNYTPATPEIAALGKYIETPVNLYSGLPQVNIPLYTINQKRYSVPVSLSYHASGIKVEEVASRSGIGWTLNAGGMITRQVRGGIDERGFLYSSRTISYFKNQVASGNNENLREEIFYTSIGERDYEPDLFSFSFNGYSGSFYFDQTTKLPVLTEHSPLKITYETENANNGKRISSFTITGPNGVKYYFGKDRLHTSSDVEIRGGFNKEMSYSFTDYRIDSTEDADQETQEYVSSWFLKEIYDPIAEESVTFDYQKNTNVSYIYRKSEVKEIVEWLVHPNVVPISLGCKKPRSKLKQYFGQSTYDEYWVSQINFNHGKVIFEQDQSVEREDLSNSHRLRNISIYDTSDLLIKQFELFHFYTTDNSSYSGTKIYNGYPFIDEHLNDTQPLEYARKRLFLDNIREYAIVNNQADTNNYKRYKFDYESPNQMPSRFSTAQDFWGYFNGERLNTNLIQLDYYQHRNFFTGPNGKSELVGTADRSVYEEKCKVGTLKKITYPTGGSKEFIFESNRIEEDIDLYTISNSTEKVRHDFSDLDTQYITNDGSIERRDFKFEMEFEVKNLELSGHDSQNITFYYDIPCTVDEGDEDSCPWDITLVDVQSNTDIYRVFIRSGEIMLNLKAGTYKLLGRRGVQYEETPIDLTRPGNGDPLFEMWFTTFKDKIPDTETLTGGLRIAEIISNTDEESLSNMSKKYTYEDTLGKSSGNLVSKPYFQDVAYVKTCFDIYETTRFAYLTKYPHLQMFYTSNSSVPLFRTSGSYTGYTKVTEHEAGYGTGKIEYTYTFFAKKSFSDFSFENFRTLSIDPNIQDYPYSPKDDLEYKRGKLLSKTVHRWHNEEFLKVSEEINTYDIDVTKHSQEAIKIVPMLASNNISTINAVGAMRNYYLNSTYNLISSKVVKTYNVGTNTHITDSITYSYNPETLNTTRKKHYNSTIPNSGLLSDTRYYYPDDINGLNDISTAQKNIIESLNRDNDHRVSELVMSKTNGSSQFETKTKLFYNQWGVEDKTFMEYTQTKKEGYPGDGFVTGKILQYDDYGNPIEVQEKENGPITSYIWGYHRSFPIAVLSNVSYSDLSYDFIDNLTNLSDQDTDSCSENSCSEQALRNELQQLRNQHPKGMVTTYTYDPVIGMTSSTDPKGLTSYYNYDSFNRLKFIKDYNGKVLQEYNYNYKNQ